MNKSKEMSAEAWSAEAWSALLRLAKFWARKGGAMQRRIYFHLRRRLKTLRARSSSSSRERQFSFDDLSTARRRPRLRFLCVDLPATCGERDELVFFEEERSCVALEDDNGDDGVEEEEEEDGGVDREAEEFIRRFYEQMKLQRQISLLQYNEMLLRSTS